MPLPFFIQMAKLPDPFDWLKPCWLKRWTNQQKARNAILHNSRKPKLTPEGARRDHREMLRFLGLNALLGMLIGIGVGIALIALDIGGLRRLITRAANPVLPLFLVLVPFASLFGGAVTASAILTLPYESKFQEEEDKKSEDDPSSRRNSDQPRYGTKGGFVDANQLSLADHRYQACMETSLYLPVKQFLETCGYSVKGEIGGCDIVALSEGDPTVMVVCELKLSFNLELILQAVDRASAADEVWIAARVSAKGRGREADKRYRDLCRRLGIGMLGVSDKGEVSILVSSVSPMPRTNPKRRTKLIREHRKRQGDPALGGSTKIPIMTAYRQQALACACALVDGPLRPRDLKAITPKAGAMLRDNYYGWFERIDKGIYGLSEGGLKTVEKMAGINSPSTSAITTT